MYYKGWITYFVIVIVIVITSSLSTEPCLRHVWVLLAGDLAMYEQSRSNHAYTYIQIDI